MTPATPMHAVEWIQLHGNKLRSIGANKLRTSLDRKKGECTWCGQMVKKPRRYWCSKECTDAFAERDPQFVRRILEKRDRGICALCNSDTLKLASFLTKLWYGFGSEYSSKELSEWRDVYRFYEIHLNSLGFHSGRGRLFRAPLWEADHVLPVAEGGGLCPPSGYQTVCLPCHAAKTRAQNKRKLRQKREPKARRSVRDRNA